MPLPSTPADEADPVPSSPSAAEICQWLVNRLSEIQRLEPADIPLDQPLVQMGLDSMQSVVLIGEVEQWLKCRFSGNPLTKYPTINTLCVFLADQLAKGKRLINPTKS
jgi:acyl carrier protein